MSHSRYWLITAQLLLAVSSLRAQETATKILPQLVSGPGLASRVLLLNSSSGWADISLELVAGPLTMGTLTQTRVLLSLPPGAATDWELPVSTAIWVGYGRLEISGGNVSAQAVLTFGAEETSLEAVPITTEFLSLVDQSPAASPGLAIVNPGSSVLTVTLSWTPRDGSTVFDAQVEVAPRAQWVGTIADQFPEAPNPFLGSLLLRSPTLFAAGVLHRTPAGEWYSLGLQSSALGVTDPLFSGERAFDHVVWQVGQGPRLVGSEALSRTADRIVSTMTELGWRARVVLETIRIGNVPVVIRNIEARWGRGPITLLGAHYDSRILSDNDPDIERRMEPTPGANDGASGVAVLLELARVLSTSYQPTGEIRLVFFDAEDNGRIEPWDSFSGPGQSGWIIGSSIYASQLDPETDPVDRFILLDLVGDTDQEFPIEGSSQSSAPELVDAIWSAAAELGFSSQFPRRVRGPILDDHVPFINRGIPSVDIIDLDYAAWHTTMDTPDQVSPRSLERVGLVLERFLENADLVRRRPGAARRN